MSPGSKNFNRWKGRRWSFPNHPGYIDPPIVLAHVQFKQQLRPVVYETVYRRRLLHPLMLLMRAFEVPDLTKASQQSRQQAMAMIDGVAAALNRGDSLLLYPSGRITRTGIETIGSARVTAELLQRCPQANVVLVRNTGLWGSMFGCAWTGSLPNLSKVTLSAVGLTLANLVFFLPRRRVELEIEVLDRSQLPGTTREEVNPFLGAMVQQENRGGRQGGGRADLRALSFSLRPAPPETSKRSPWPATRP